MIKRQRYFILGFSMVILLLSCVGQISNAQQESAKVLDPEPNLVFVQATVDDSTGGNNNQILEPGETAKIAIRIFNAGTATAFSVSGSIDTTTSNVTVTDRVATFGNVLPKNVVQTQSPHFSVSVGSTVPCGSDIHFNLTLIATNYQKAVSFVLLMRSIPAMDSATFTEESVIYGADASDGAGNIIASGDINGDGYDDLIIGVPAANGPGNSRSYAGEVWVLYGSSSGLSSTIDLSSSPGNSTVIYGADSGDHAGSSVASGDINGDGYDDVIIGAPYSYGLNNTEVDAGEVWIIFGSSSGLGSSIDLSTPPSSAVAYYGNNDDWAGKSVATGDINGDGYDDLIAYLPLADCENDSKASQGEIWVIYGKPTMYSGTFTTPGYDLAICCASTNVDYFPGGSSLSSGDLNGDGYDEVIWGGTYVACPDGNGYCGEISIVYGSASRTGWLDLSETNPPSGTSLIHGSQGGDALGMSVATGDINGDGYDDLIMGVPDTNGRGDTKTDAGEAWIFYGSSTKFNSWISLDAPPENSTVIYGADAGDRCGIGVSAGDINGDGYDDVIVGAGAADSKNNSRSDAGEAWVIYGSMNGISPAVDLYSPPINAEVFWGSDASDWAGGGVSSADLNGDGYKDVIIGANGADGPTNSRASAGEAYAFYGRPFDFYYVKTDTYSFIDASTGINLNLHCDSCCKPVPIGFTFSYYGIGYDSLFVCDDGYISFSPVQNPSPINSCPPSRQSPNNVVAAFWDDLNPGAGIGNVFTLAEGISPNRRFTIEWQNVPYYPNTGNGTFEITLYESSNQILVQYQDTIFGNSADSGATAAAGLENQTGVNGKSYSCLTSQLANSTAWRAIPIGQYQIFVNYAEVPGGWTATGLWHSEGSGSTCTPNYRSPNTSWYYGQASSCDYNTGGANSGTLTSPQFGADYYSNFYLWHRKNSEMGYDRTYVQISENGGPLTTHKELTTNCNTWCPVTIDVSSHSGKNLNLGFYFTADATMNSTLGWMIDNMEVWGCNVYGTSPLKALAYASPNPVCETSSFLLDGTGTYSVGCDSLTYQWYENGSPITGATALSYTVPAHHTPGNFAYTLQATCTNPPQSNISDPVMVNITAMPSAVSNSLHVTKTSSGAILHFQWANVSGASSYFLFSDTSPAGTFATQAGSSPSGNIGLDVTMPSTVRLFYLVAGYNEVCGLGSLRY